VLSLIKPSHSFFDETFDIYVTKDRRRQPSATLAINWLRSAAENLGLPWLGHQTVD
jgi:hypothetical protein